jgi:chemotaxis signal transduction protein
VKDLPFICQTPWSTKAALHGGQAAAIVDLAALLSNSADVSDAEALSTRYRPESSFPSVFGRQDVQVMELLVKGRRLAIPKVEIIDVIPCAPTYVVPRAQGIVAAVANLAGELLPVIDLARIMGASSSPTARWNMIVLSNGTFRALILSERAPETRLLKPGVQRDVPVHLPYPVVYGCYTEGEGIRLILNVYALALHFDESRATELLPPLTPAEITREVQAQRTEEAEPEAPIAAPPVETVPPPATEGVHQDTIRAEPALDEPLFQEVTQPLDEQQTPTAGPDNAEEAPPPDPAPAAAAAPAAEPEPAPVVQEEDLFVEEVHVRRQVVVEQPAHRGRRMLAAFAASVILIIGSILGFYFSGLVHEPTAALEALPQAATAAAQAPSQQAAAPAAPAQLAPAAAPQQTPAPAAPPQQASAPAAAPQPANAAAMYTVKVGDTLWDIAQRFTGDPLNYHNIAGKNLIKNPDLIFPGQTLQVEATQKQ